MKGKIQLLIRVLRKKDTATFLIFLALSVAFFVGFTFFQDAFAKVGSALLFIELLVLITVAWAFAGHAVMKSLFLVGASLSLIIFLAQSYCDVPSIARTGDDALKTLLAFGFLYIAADFLRALYKEVTDRTKTLKQANGGKHPWLFLLPFALFTGLFVWQVMQVLLPILQNLCVYK